MRQLLILITLSYFNIGFILHFHTYDFENKVFSTIVIFVLSLYSYKSLKQLIKITSTPQITDNSNKIIDTTVVESTPSATFQQTSDSFSEPFNKTVKNPKFFRSEYEEELSFRFSIKHEQKIAVFEDALYNSAFNIDDSVEIDDIIANLKNTILIFYNFQKYCYSQGKGGTIYFQDMWEHCHNSKNPCFSYVTQFEERLDFLMKNYDNEKKILIERAKWRDFRDNIQSILLTAISEHEGILQKDFYTLFDPAYKSYIQKELKLLSDQKLIIREKYGSSYKLQSTQSPKQ